MNETSIPEVRFGNEQPVAWRTENDDSRDDDEQLAETPEYVTKMLGFDPAKETGDAG